MMRSVALPTRRAAGRLASLTGFMLLMGLTPVAAQSRRPPPEILVGKFPLGARIHILDTAATSAVTRARVCGMPPVAPAEAEGVRLALRRWQDENLVASPGGTIRVAFHVITASGEGDVSEQRLQEQIEELNRDYAGSGYRFEMRIAGARRPGQYTIPNNNSAE